MADKDSSAYSAWFGTGRLRKPSFKLSADAELSPLFAKELSRAIIIDDPKGISLDLSLQPSGSDALTPGSYNITSWDGRVMILGGDYSGLLYGVFDFVRRLRLGVDFLSATERNDVTVQPVVQHRALNHWDNMDGSIERGYAGRSLFFEGGDIVFDKERLTDYARLLASVGINEICLNNVNVSPRAALLITDLLLPDLAKIAGIFREYGVRLLIAVEFSSPLTIGHLPTCDPLDDKVSEWWRRQADVVYSYIPDLAGFLVKADSEFRIGPAALGRTQADGANVIAGALAQHGGVLYWRCFVYNCEQDWRDAKTDRPMSAYNHFHALDGHFAENVILQVKNGPVDFQVREPLSPLLGAMKQTKEALEFQIAGEYTGHEIDVYSDAVAFSDVLNSPVDENKQLADIIGADKDIIAVVAVAGVGRETSWTGHPLEQLNLFAFGHLAINPRVSAAPLTTAWARLTFGDDKNVIETVTNILAVSRGAYEQYVSPLGLGFMVNIGHHYGPSPEGYEFMKWGTYHRANHDSVGVDRTTKGTGYTGQYPAYIRDFYENLDTCPENLLLFFHRVRYDYVMHDGRTLLQRIYDDHFEGAEKVGEFVEKWHSLRGLVPEDIFIDVEARLKKQQQNANEWRDVINTYFYRFTGIKDARGRKIYD